MLVNNEEVLKLETLIITIKIFGNYQRLTNAMYYF